MVYCILFPNSDLFSVIQIHAAFKLKLKQIKTRSFDKTYENNKDYKKK